VRLFHSPDEETLRTLPLKLLNRQRDNIALKVDDFWNQFAARRESARAFAESVKDLPPEKLVEAVRAKLRELNDGNDLTFSHVTDADVITGATLDCWNAPNMEFTPLMGFPSLKNVTLNDAYPWLDLSPLKFLPLEELNCPEPLARRNAPVLKEIATLKTINGQPAEAFWKE